ncbi:MAG: hypothetical protein NVS3B14_07000 [Ktedonobacteraceae bacterium]
MLLDCLQAIQQTYARPLVVVVVYRRVSLFQPVFQAKSDGAHRQFLAQLING